MHSYREDLISIMVLEAAESTNAPVGAGSVSLMLRNNGINISEAGAGRILRSLREKGFLEKIGFQGHVVTPRGTIELSSLKAARQTAETLDMLLKNSENIKGYSVTDILAARRAIEREAAMHTALKATPEDIAILENIIKQQYKEMERKGYYADISVEFHREVIRIAGIPLLKILYEFIGLSVEWQNFFIETFRLSNTPLNIQHEKILAAIKKRDPKEAADLMEEHLTEVMQIAGSFSALHKK
ncbi:MAG: FCD domain-containing protein [Synergistaceae bacterium]|nr:FCD domain-containing protein [Synergistaceae bacterium]